MNRNAVLAIAIILAVVLACSDEEGKAKRAAEKEAAQKLRAAASDLAQLPDKTQLTNEPYIRGKMAIVRKEAGGSFYMYDPDMAVYGDAYARAPEEVQTVVLRTCERTQKGIYRTRENPPRELSAFATDCDVTLVDRTIPAVIFKKRFEAKLKDEAVTSGNTRQVEAHAGYEVDEFLKSLPRK
jgi:hypothetical protein